MTGTCHDAEEVAQDTFLRAYRALGTTRRTHPRVEEKAWACRMRQRRALSGEGRQARGSSS